MGAGKDLCGEGAADDLAGWKGSYKVGGRRHPHLILARMIFPRAALIDYHSLADLYRAWSVRYLPW